MSIISTIKYIVNTYKNINFGYKENFGKFLTILDSTYSKIRDNYNDQEIEGHLAEAIWPDAKAQALASDSLDYAIRDWFQYNQVPLWDIKETSLVLDLSSEQEQDFLRILRSKRPGQINHFSNIDFYLKYIRQVGFGKSSFFWSYLEETVLGDEWNPGISFREALRRVKIIQGLNLGKDALYSFSEYKELIELSLKHLWIYKVLKELDVSNWYEQRIPTLCKNIEKTSIKDHKTYESFAWNVYLGIYNNSFINALYHYTDGVSASFDELHCCEAEKVFCSQNMENLRKMGKEKVSPSSLKWVGLNCPNNYICLSKLLTRDGCYADKSITDNNTLTAIGKSIAEKPGYYEEMKTFPTGEVRSKVLAGGLSKLLSGVSNGLKCSKKEALEHIKQGHYEAHHFMSYDIFYPLSYEMRNSDNWAVYHWWLAKKDSAAWDRERVTYGPEGREFHFKYRSLLDEIRPEDLINGEKTSPDKAIEHACQRRQETIESALGCDWSPLPECELKGNDEFKQLMTPADLVNAGKHFQNCVGGYANACKNRRCYIFASEDICAEINFDSTDTWRVRQCLSFYNSQPNPDSRERFDSWFRMAILKWHQERETSERLTA